MFIVKKLLAVALAVLLLANPLTTIGSAAAQGKVVCLTAKFVQPKGVVLSGQNNESTLVKKLTNIPADELALIKKCYAGWKASPQGGVEAKLPYIVERGPTPVRLTVVLCVGRDGYVYDKTFTPSKNFTYQFKNSELQSGSQNKAVKKHCK